MSLDLDKIGEAMLEDLKNPDGYWNTLIKQMKLESARLDKIDKWLETNDFEPMFRKLLLRNGENRSEWCYKNGYQKYGTPLMELLCTYISNRCTPATNEKLDNAFQSGLWEFKGYWFELNCGQGCYWRIYDQDLNIVEDV